MSNAHENIENEQMNQMNQETFPDNKKITRNEEKFEKLWKQKVWISLMYQWSKKSCENCH